MTHNNHGPAPTNRQTVRRSKRMVGKTLLLGLAGLATIGVGVLTLGGPASIAKQVMVYKSPSCGCCSKWADYLRAEGFAVTVKAAADMADVKERFATPWQLESCHTAVVDDYVIEGHVPVREIDRLLSERPAAIGIAVPGMPAGSPGMAGRYVDSFDVTLFRADGSTEIYARY